ncbi:hypothetical protein ACFXDH_12220 [Streptomyces sp. NPDC059467]|uniref:hypothetical protein n=1 Tax=Streptomyces sp. NPDC059467 TaxID=3346844 RepID=UPI00368FAA2E
MSGSSRALRVLLSLAALAGLSACETAAEARPSAAATTAGGTVTLTRATSLPTGLRTLGTDGALQLPSGWNVAGYGVHRSGRYAVFGAVSPAGGSAGSGVGSAASTRPTETWVVDTRTGVTHRYAQINSGWYAGVVLAANGWAIRKEVQQVSDSECGGKTSYDCFNWRLYVQRLPSGRPRLLARSAKPGSQSLSPSPVTDGRRIAWEQGDGSGKVSVEEWTPGTSKSERVAVRSTAGTLALTGGNLYVNEASGTASNGVALHTVTRLALPGDPAGVATPVTTYKGSGTAAITGHEVLYFPKPADGSGQWALAALGTRAGHGQVSKLLKPALSGPYLAEWLTGGKFVSWSVSGLTVYDTPSDSGLTFSTEATGFTTPRANSGYLDLGYNPGGKKNSLIAWKRY